MLNQLIFNKMYICVILLNMKKIFLCIKKIFIIFIFYIILYLLMNIINLIIHNNNLANLITYIIIYIFFIIKYKNEIYFKKDKKLIKYFIIFIISFIVTNILKYIFTNYFNIISINESSNILMFNNSKFIYFLIITIFAPFYEEILFRYNFKNIFNNKYLYIIISSIIFALFHLISINNYLELIYFIPYFIMGIMLSYIYIDSDNIMYSYAFHSLNNCLILIKLLIGW